MLNADFGGSKTQTPKTNPNHNTNSGSPANRPESKRHFDRLDSSGAPTIQTPLVKRLCRLSVSDQAGTLREQLGGKGMFLQRMKDAGLKVPPFQCVTTQVVKALEQHPLNPHSLARYLPDTACEPGAQTSLAHVREYLNTLPPSEHVKRTEVLRGMAEFIVSDDFYQQIKDSEAAQQIRDLRGQLDKPSLSPPVIVRSSGIHEDNYGDAQAGKYLSLVQEEDDVLRTCLKVMASGYRPEVCPAGAPQPMALIIQECIDCQCGGVIMSFGSFRDGTIGVEFARGQPRGVVAGLSGNTPHRIDIAYEEGPDSYQYFPGTISSHYILRKSNNGYSETRIDNADAHKDDVSHLVTDKMVSDIRKMVTTLENLLRCPVDAEFGISPEGELCVVQVRPVTQLSGDMDFAMPIPEETIATGAGVSEGFCTGTLWLAVKGKAYAMPEGAIVVAQHAEDWMLEPEFLKRVGGIVIARGGSNDHFAIGMKQQQKTLMLAGDQFEFVVAQAGQQATLACARFDDKPGAFIVAGDISAKLASYKKLSTSFDVSQAQAVPSRDDLSFPEGAFLEVASGFQWLTDQNARLLAFFAPGGGLDCLANPVKLSMSPQRSELLANTKENVNRLVGGAEGLLDGYDAFLRLAGTRQSSEIQPLLKELPELINRFRTLKQTIQSGLDRIIQPMKATEEGRLSPGTFRQWLADCHKLQSDLQALDPGQAEQVRSVHELIFAVHQRFVKALAPVTLASGQGRLSKGGKRGKVIYIDCTTLGKLSEKTPLLTPSGKTAIEKLLRQATVISTDDALVVNLEFGIHLGLIELLEHAEGGKGRTLRLKFSDTFRKPDGSDEPGKLKRMWFLVQLLKAIELGKNANTMTLSCNAVAGDIIVEYPGMSSRLAMQKAFEKLMTVLEAIRDLDRHFDYVNTFKRERWDFNLLAQRLDRDSVTDADRFAFQHCLFSMFNSERASIMSECCKLLSNHHQQFIDHIQQLVESNDNPREVLMKINENTRRELLHHFLLFDPQIAISEVELLYGLSDEGFIIKPTYSYELEFYLPPGHPLLDDKEKVKEILLKDGLQYASRQIRSDKEVVLPTIKKYPEQLGFVSEELKDDKEVVLAAVIKNGNQLEYASPKLQDDKEVVMAAVKQNSAALFFASEKMRGDKSIIKVVIADHISYLQYASETLLNDREFMLGLIAEYPQAFGCVSSELRKDQDFIKSARLRNPEVDDYVPKANKV